MQAVAPLCLRDVAQRFLHDAVDADLDLRRQPRVHRLRQLRADAGAMRKIPKVGRERRGQPEIVEHGRVQQLRHVADAAQRGLADVARFLERGSDARVDVGAKRDADVHLDGGQRLADLVVQLARQRAALLFLDVDEPRGQALEILAVLLLDPPLPLDLLLQPVDVPRRHDRDHERDEQRSRRPSTAAACAPGDRAARSPADGAGWRPPGARAS